MNKRDFLKFLGFSGALVSFPVLAKLPAVRNNIVWQCAYMPSGKWYFETSMWISGEEYWSCDRINGEEMHGKDYFRNIRHVYLNTTRDLLKKNLGNRLELEAIVKDWQSLPIVTANYHIEYIDDDTDVRRYKYIKGKKIPHYTKGLLNNG